MKKQRKLSLKKVNVAQINYAQLIKGGGQTNIPLDCVSEQTDPLTTCPLSLREDCKTDNTRGNGSI